MSFQITSENFEVLLKITLTTVTVISTGKIME